MVEVDGEPVHESYLSPELWLTPHTASDEDGDPVVRMELVDFDSN